MEPQFWLERWEKSEIGFHQQEINRALQSRWPALGLPRGATVFVPLCGKSRDMVWLRDQGHSVLGIEFIRIAVRDFFAENGMTPKISPPPRFERWEANGITVLCGDFFDLTAEDLKEVRAIYDRASLIALPPVMRPRYVAKLDEIAPSGVPCLLITVSYPQEQMPGPPFAVTEQEVRTLYAGKFEVELLTTQDILSRDSGFRRRGLTQMVGQVYRLRKLER